MESKIKGLIESFKVQLKDAKDVASVRALKISFMGKNGVFTDIMKGLKDVAKEDKPKMGKFINDAKTIIETELKSAEEAFENAGKEERLKEEAIDVTLPSKKQTPGTLHPLTKIRNEIIDAFMCLGFTVTGGPEVQTDYHCFQALNIPKDHPARDMQDTFYIDENVVLRPHTSPDQILTMESTEPPIKVLCPGRVYRADDDATHSPMFHQIEGLVVDEKITLCDLKGILDEFAKKLFTEETKTRFRPSHFPFTEPSVEVDVSCMMCGGKGCRLCKGTGWIEVLGSGMVHQNVLSNCGIDPEKYTGFAFGMGVERIAMIKYGIPDMRLLFENDVRFLKQFK
ncbi:MAG: phenylalanine--tRNA ligase subunit alpha [Bacillota bacterium]